MRERVFLGISTKSKGYSFFFISLLFLLLPTACFFPKSTTITITPFQVTPPESTITVTPSSTPNLEPMNSTHPTFYIAEGFGSKTVGGRGGKVIEIVNLNDSGIGSLRFCAEASGPRICVFTIGGTIILDSTISVVSPYLTIAGQTASGGGITLRAGNGRTDPLLHIDTHDVIVQYLTFRAGPPAAGDAMNISTRDQGTYNVVVDHNSMSWGVDQIFATWYDVHDISIQWNIFSEALDCSIHPKGCHSKGPMLASACGNENCTRLGARDISFHHNVIAHVFERAPLVKTAGLSDIVNNVIYNTRYDFSHVDMEDQLTKVLANYHSNVFIEGPDTRSPRWGIAPANIETIGAEIYIEDNFLYRKDGSVGMGIDVVKPSAHQFLVNIPFPAPPVSYASPELILAKAGNSHALACDGSWYYRRDAIDERVISEIETRTGRIINDPSEVGGWIDIESGTPCLDTDHDGMPDIWEVNYGFNPYDDTDMISDVDKDGYTNIEEYLNGTTPIN